jgi:hypothetical protein
MFFSVILVYDIGDQETVIFYTELLRAAPIVEAAEVPHLSWSPQHQDISPGNAAITLTTLTISVKRIMRKKLWRGSTSISNQSIVGLLS